MQSKFLVGPVALLSLLFACGGSTTSVGASPDGGSTGGGCEKCSIPHAPAKHRAAAATCSTDRSTNEPGFSDENGTCKQNSDCTEGRDGRCRLSRGGPFCSYNECSADSDCKGGGVCNCGDPNFCATGDCRVDTDCGAGGYCSPSLGSCGDYGGIAGFYCHRANDECVDDEDCGNPAAGAYCAFDPAAANWKCSDTQCAG